MKSVHNGIQFTVGKVSASSGLELGAAGSALYLLSYGAQNTKLRCEARQK